MRVYDHPDLDLHDPPSYQGAPRARLAAVRAALAGASSVCAPPATRADLALCHAPAYIEAVLADIPEGREAAFDFQTFAGPGTARAAARSAGLALSAAAAVCAGEAPGGAFVLASCGGHHAEADWASGFCFLSHAALAGVYAQARGLARRVAVFDFDAHHGNGTQSLFWNHADRMLISLHEDTQGSGLRLERGAAGNIVNIPLAPGSGSEVFRLAVKGEALPALAAFAPDLLIISAGFDGHVADSFSSLRLERGDYGWLGLRLKEMAARTRAKSLVAILEGGYDLGALGQSVGAFVWGEDGND